MSTEKNRETFEAELCRLDVKCVRRVYGEEAELYGLEDGDYFGLEARSGWHFWQASRAALVIELKPPHTDYGNYSDREEVGASKYYEQARKAIEAAGLKVKP
jgi:hypothetical protein